MESECTENCSTSSLDSEVTPSTSTEVINKLGMCEVCACKAAKYTCPRCEVKTCCLRCAKIHKQELECDGTRDKAKFIPLNKFTNLDVSSDYRLLEEVARNVEFLKKNRRGKHTRLNGELPNHLYRLRRATDSRKTTLKFLPRNFERHRINTTQLHFISNVIFWRIDWIFSNVDNLKLSDARVPETVKLSNVLQKYFKKQEDNALQEKLQYYQAVDLPGIKLLLKAEQKAGHKYYELDPLESLKDNLKNKIIIEYPTIYVILKEHADLYDVLDSDCEDEEMVVDEKKLNGNETVDRIVKKSEREDNLNSSLKNLLFISELYEEDSDVE